MAINFPINPGLGAVHSASGKTWTWNGAQWEGVPQTAGIPFGTSVNRPANPDLGQPYFNADQARLELYTSETGWQNVVQETPAVVSISGLYAEGNSSNTLTINGTNFASGAIAYAVGTDGVEVQADTTTLISVVQLTATFSGLSKLNEPYDIKVINPSNLYGVLFETLQIDDIPVFLTQSGTLGTYLEESPMSVQISATDEESSNLVFSVSSGNLPAGLTLNPATGLISGTPTDIIPNTTYSFIVSVTDGNNTATRNFDITINDRGPAWVTPQTLSAFSVGISYSQQLASSDDNGIAAYTLVSGSLPPGLSLSSSGLISGTPTSDTSAFFTIRATDIGGNYVDRQFTIPNTGPAWQTPSTFDVSSESNSIQLSAIDDSGVNPTYTVTSGALPSGMSLSSTGLLSGGSAEAAGHAATFTVAATDNNGAASSRTFTATTFIVLYSFTSHTFTNAGATGINGPTLSQVRSVYNTSWSTQFLGMTSQGIQEWTVPVNGTYRIEAAGAKGGDNTSSSKSGGSGVILSGEFVLNANNKIKVAVGQQGLSEGSSGSGGGGGGTFVTTFDNSPLIIAGGGGGATDDGDGQGAGVDASYATSGTSSRGGTAFFGTSGSGGSSPGEDWSGGSGAGLLSDGSQPRGGGGFEGTAPLSFIAGAIGGNSVNSWTYGSAGGFGGGGGGSWAGAGGGGYSGGSADASNGSGNDKEGGGGGGSYNSGSNQQQVGLNSAHGYVTITKL